MKRKAILISLLALVIFVGLSLISFPAYSSSPVVNCEGVNENGHKFQCQGSSTVFCADVYEGNHLVACNGKMFLFPRIDE